MKRKLCWFLMALSFLMVSAVFMGAYQPECSPAQDPMDNVCMDTNGNLETGVTCNSSIVFDGCNMTNYDSCNCDANSVGTYTACPSKMKDRDFVHKCYCPVGQCFQDDTTGCIDSNLKGIFVEGNVRKSSTYEGLAGEVVGLRNGSSEVQKVYTDNDGYFIFNFVDLSLGSADETFHVVWSDKTDSVTYYRNSKLSRHFTQFEQ